MKRRIFLIVQGMATKEGARVDQLEEVAPGIFEYPRVPGITITASDGDPSKSRLRVIELAKAAQIDKGKTQ